MWTFILHEDGWHFAESLKRADRQRLTRAMRDLASKPFCDPEREFTPRHDRTYSIVTLGGFTLTYWLDLRIHQVVITAIERA